MSLILKEPIAGPAAWRGVDLADSEAWIFQFTDTDIAALDDALSHARSRGIVFPHIRQEDFPLLALKPRLWCDVCQVEMTWE